jgi:hypothetical protein
MAYSGSTCEGENNIIYDNFSTTFPDIYGTVRFNYSCCSQTIAGTANTTASPLLHYNPPQGYCFLSQTSAGQTSNSPCVDAGNPGTAMVVGATRSDFVNDIGVLDMGYHWTEPFNAWPGATGLFDEEETVPVIGLLPQSSKLSVANYPNPFNPTTMITLNLNEPGELTLVVTDIAGRVVSTLQEGYLQSGTYQYQFDGADLASGVYFYKAILGSEVEVGKALLVK